MSLKVELKDLASTVQEHGAGFLITSGSGGSPHVMHLMFDLVQSDGGVTATSSVGNSARANIESNPSVTLLWPPFEKGGYSLIADGQAHCTESQVTIEITGAVLHRPAE